MSKLPSLKSRDVIRILQKIEWGNKGTFVLKQLNSIAVKQPPPLNWPPCLPLMS
jgi:hypothetical protein